MHFQFFIVAFNLEWKGGPNVGSPPFIYLQFSITVGLVRACQQPLEPLNGGCTNLFYYAYALMGGQVSHLLIFKIKPLSPLKIFCHMSMSCCPAYLVSKISSLVFQIETVAEIEPAKVRWFTLSDKISVDKSAKNLVCCRKFCPPKILSAEIFCPLKFTMYHQIISKSYQTYVKT